MTWTKLSDDFSDDCWELTSDAYRLHVEGLNWTMRKLSGGVLPKHEMPRWAKYPEAATELVDRGYWRDEGTHYVICHHMGYQREADKILAQQAANRRNGMKGGRPRGADIKPPKTDSLTDSQTDSVFDRESPPRPGSDGPTEKRQETSELLTESKTERDWTGLAWTGELAPAEKNRNEEPYVPSAEMSRRINENVRLGYES